MRFGRYYEVIAQYLMKYNAQSQQLIYLEEKRREQRTPRTKRSPTVDVT